MAEMVIRWEVALARDKIARFRNIYPGSIARALNRAIVSSRTFQVARIAADMRMKSGDVKKEMRVIEASPTKLDARLEVHGNRLPVYKFGAKGPVPSRGRGRGVTANTPARFYPHAFIATVRAGRSSSSSGESGSHTGVFVRKEGARRLPIVELRYASLPAVFHKYAPEGLERGYTSLLKNLRSELSYAMRQ